MTVGLRFAAVLAAAVASAVSAGCGGGSDGGSEPGTLRDGVYEFELAEEYMLDNGLPADQAENENGVHETTLDNGSFTDRWHANNGTTGSCTGTYKADGNRVTFKWTTGCVGDWEMTYAVEGDTVSWQAIETLPPHNSDDDQKAAEVFNSIPWVRVGDVPESS